ncbi:MAG: hypothetical protein PHS60_10550 [Zavarzinia sp.]|nr:hypothetical protein [Zavarzinia sp.]
MAFLLHVVAGTGGGVAFLVFYLGLGAGAFASLAAGAAAYVALRLIGRAMKAPLIATGTAAGDLVTGAGERLRRLETLARSANPAVARWLDAVVAAAMPLVEDVGRHPERAMEARRLLGFWLDLAVRMGEHAETIRALKGDAHPGLAKICAMLEEVVNAFAAHADSAAAAELSRLELDLAVLERSLEAERGSH